jgi:hypothetical protein
MSNNKDDVIIDLVAVGDVGAKAVVEPTVHISIKDREYVVVLVIDGMMFFIIAL